MGSIRTLSNLLSNDDIRELIYGYGLTSPIINCLVAYQCAIQNDSPSETQEAL